MLPASSLPHLRQRLYRWLSSFRATTNSWMPNLQRQGLLLMVASCEECWNGRPAVTRLWNHADITLRPWARAQGSFCDSMGRTLVCVSGCHHSVTQVQ